MAMKATQVTTGEVRISYEHLLKPSVKGKYSCTLMIPKSDVATKQRIDAAIQVAIQEGVTGKWGGVRPVQISVPIHDGDGPRPSDGEKYGDECRGYWVMAASSEQQQEVVDMSLQPILNATEIYSGMYAHVGVTFYPYLKEGKKGVGCGLGPVQKTRDGEPLAGRMSAVDVFSGAQQPAYPQAQPYAAQYAPTQPSYAVQQPSYPTQPYAAQGYPPPAQQPYPGSYAPQVNPLTGEIVG